MYNYLLFESQLRKKNIFNTLKRVLTLNNNHLKRFCACILLLWVNANIGLGVSDVFLGGIGIGWLLGASGARRHLKANFTTALVFWHIFGVQKLVFKWNFVNFLKDLNLFCKFSVKTCRGIHNYKPHPLKSIKTFPNEQANTSTARYFRQTSTKTLTKPPNTSYKTRNKSQKKKLLYKAAQNNKKACNGNQTKWCRQLIKN